MIELVIWAKIRWKRRRKCFLGVIYIKMMNFQRSDQCRQTALKFQAFFIEIHRKFSNFLRLTIISFIKSQRSDQCTSHRWYSFRSNKSWMNNYFRNLNFSAIRKTHKNVESTRLKTNSQDFSLLICSGPVYSLWIPFEISRNDH